MSKSAVAGIIDRGGGMRVVVTQRWRMRHHVKKGERLFVVPGLEVQEPVPWDEIPAVIHATHKHVSRCLAPVNPCGECNLCCKVMYIEENDFKKPSGAMCKHCEVGKGCAIHCVRPRACRDFQCLWLKSQSRNEIMAAELRPDRCGVVMTEDTSGVDPDLFEVHVDPDRPEALDGADLKAFIDMEQARGRKAKLITFYYGEDR